VTELPKNLARPDESIRFPGITEDLVEIAGMTIARTVQEPGWRWSKDMRPLVGGDWCEARHIGLTLSGRHGALLRDGTVIEFGPDDLYDIPPGHDGYTVGAEPAVMIEWSGMRAFARSLGEFGDRILAALLFTDLVQSTDELKDAGDVSWRETLATYDLAVRSEVERFGGRVVDTAGDGMFAAFDAPARALRCASAVLAAAATHGLRARAGVHVGEVATDGAAIRGIAVHETARIMSSAAPGEVLVSESVPPLVSGLGLEFLDRGDHELKDFGVRRLLAFTG
jgi:class 3 adenylate cyclase